MSIFEYGSGGSTLFFARRCASVVSIEDNRLWFDAVQRRLIETKLTNVVLEHRPFNFRNPVNFGNSAYLHSIPARKFDVMVVDGTEEFIGQEDAVQMRPTCFHHAENFIRPGGIIVLDDSWWYPELRRANHAKECRIFKSVGPCRPGVTSTDVYFY
jgi:hypothetical protein